MNRHANDLILAAAFGWLCGMRSLSGPALAGPRLLRDKRASSLIGVAAAGELIADKHPAMPNRNSPPALAGRIMMGAVTGAAIVVSGEGKVKGSPIRGRRRMSRSLGSGETFALAALGGLIGGASAAVSTQVTYHMRRRIGTATKLPDPAIAVAEDVLTYGSGALLAQALDR